MLKSTDWATSKASEIAPEASSKIRGSSDSAFSLDVAWWRALRFLRRSLRAWRDFLLRAMAFSSLNIESALPARVDRSVFLNLGVRRVVLQSPEGTIGANNPNDEAIALIAGA